MSFTYQTICLNDKIILICGEIRSILTKAGTPIGANDLLIAAIAKAYQVTVVTHNLREFTRVPALQVEDWL